MVTLAECPIGLFWYGDTLCLKTEYGNSEGRIDAYIVESGEFFWGDAPQTIESQRGQLVRSVDTSEAIGCLAAHSVMSARVAELRAERDALLQKPIDLAKMDSIDEDATDRMIAYYWCQQAQDARDRLILYREALERIEEWHRDTRAGDIARAALTQKDEG